MVSVLIGFTERPLCGQRLWRLVFTLRALTYMAIKFSKSVEKSNFFQNLLEIPLSYPEIVL